MPSNAIDVPGIAAAGLARNASSAASLPYARQPPSAPPNIARRGGLPSPAHETLPERYPVRSGHARIKVMAGAALFDRVLGVLWQFRRQQRSDWAGARSAVRNISLPLSVQSATRPSSSIWTSRSRSPMRIGSSTINPPFANMQAVQRFLLQAGDHQIPIPKRREILQARPDC